MKIVSAFLLFFLFISCGRRQETGKEVISVSIAPFKYFVDEISGNRFDVNTMVPAGSNPHIYEPSPDQIKKLRKSVAYISNGCLGFEITWLDRFYEINRDMKKLNVADFIDLITSEHHNEDMKDEGADPHYWLSPESAMKIASSVNEFLGELDSLNRENYNNNYKKLYQKIITVDSMARQLSLIEGDKVFMIYHPALAYLARDYGLEEIAVEHEGKEPTPSGLKEVIDRARTENIKMILVQREIDKKNVNAIVEETGAEIQTIDPLSEDWFDSITSIIKILKNSFLMNLN
jgi:zinc transport system substrate-binding protein